MDVEYFHSPSLVTNISLLTHLGAMVRYILNEESYEKYKRKDMWIHYYVPKPNCTRCCAPYPSKYAFTHTCKSCYDESDRAEGYPDALIAGSVYLSKGFGDKAQKSTPLGKQSLEILQLKESGSHTELYADVLVNALSNRGIAISDTGIFIPIPQKRRRPSISGPYALSLALSTQTNLGVKNLLYFVRPVKSQIGLNCEQRKQNMVGTMKCNHPISPIQTVYLVDDTMTTGSTMIEAVRAVREAGAEYVVGLIAGRATSMTNLIYSGMVSKDEG